MTDLDYESAWRKPEAPTPRAADNGGVVIPIDSSGAERYAMAALKGECDAVAAAGEGTRNHTLNQAAFRMGKHIGAGSIALDVARDALANAARMAGLDTKEIDLVLRNSDNGGLIQGQAHPRYPTPMQAHAPDVTIIEAVDLAPTEVADFWSSREILHHLHDFARARRVSPWAVLGVTLARIVTATPYHYVLPAIVGGKASLNLFVGLVGTSGSGKGAAEAAASEALSVGHLETHKVGSGEGIAHGYMRRERGEVHWNDQAHAVLFSVPEIDTLTALGGRQGATLLPELRSAWSGEALGFGYADPTKRLPVPAHEYRMCLVAGIQPARAASLLEDSDGGTPQRFLWLPAADPDAPTHPPSCPPPMSWTMPGARETKGAHIIDGRTHMQVCDVARDTIIQARLDRLRGVGEALDGHALLTQLKTAAALALAEKRIEVIDKDWELADVIARKSAATRAGVERVLADAVAKQTTGRAMTEAKKAVIVETEVEKDAIRRVSRRVRKILSKAPGPMRGSELKRALASRDREHAETAIADLEKGGHIVSQYIDHRGQTGTAYTLGDGV